jgi:hypothetical protein
MKQIPIESLRVDLGVMLDKSHFCIVLPFVKLLQLKFEVFNCKKTIILIAKLCIHVHLRHGSL